MGREVYTSNEQLGGADVMGPNGISHQLVDSHIGAVASALRWLSYVPSSRGANLPVVSTINSSFGIEDAFCKPFFWWCISGFSLPNTLACTVTVNPPR